MGIMDLYAAQSGINEQPVQALPSSFGERFSAEVGAATADDRYFNLRSSQRDLWQRAIDEIHGVSGEAFVNPYGAMTSEEMTRLGSQPAVETERRNKIVQASRAARAAGNDDLFDPENIDRYIGEAGNRARSRAAEMTDTGGGLGAFLGGMLAPTPENLVGLVVPPLRISTGAAVVGNTFLRGLAREAGYQGAVNMGLEALAEGADVASRGETGTAAHAGEIATNIAMAGAAGAVLGGGIHAAHVGAVRLHRMWTGLPEEVRAKAPLEVQDAFRTIESEALYSGQNRLGVDPLIHEQNQAAAIDAAIRGRAVSLGELRPGDTPLTALSTILREQPDRLQVEGLTDVLGRAGALPDSEITAVVREMRPDLFIALDDLQHRRLELEQRVRSGEPVDQITDVEYERLRAEHEQAAAKYSEAVDAYQQARETSPTRAIFRGKFMETMAERERAKARLDAATRGLDMIEEDLRARGLMEEGGEGRGAVDASIDTQRRALEVEQQKVEAKIAQQIDSLREGLGKLDLGQPEPAALAHSLGAKTPEALADVLSRADIARRAGIAREAIPASESPAEGAVRQALAAEREVKTGASESAPDPDQVAALKTQTDAILAEPGRLGDFRRYAVKELDAADLQMKDATAAIRCAMGAPI